MPAWPAEQKILQVMDECLVKRREKHRRSSLIRWTNTTVSSLRLVILLILSPVEWITIDASSEDPPFSLFGIHKTSARSSTLDEFVITFRLWSVVVVVLRRKRRFSNDPVLIIAKVLFDSLKEKKKKYWMTSSRREQRTSASRSSSCMRNLASSMNWL